MATVPEGPLYRVPCNGEHDEPGSDHEWLVQGDDELDEMCEA